MMAQAGATAGADPVLAKAHHGSVSKEQRAQVEEELKSGILRCVVATSSLELGIDMGAVDLVIQVEAPPSAASGLQRIGRAGHQVGEVSRAALFPKHRGDVLHTAIVTERMLAGQIEAIAIPQNPLDILAQQTVAAARARPGRRRGLVRDAQAQRAVPLAPPLGLRGDARPARRALPVRRVRRAAAPRSSGTAITARSPGARARSASPSPAAARSPTAACSASSSRASRRTRASASSTRRWSTSRASTTCSPSARRAGASSRSPTTGSTSCPPSGSRARCRSGTATASAGPPSSARRSGSSRARCRRRRPRRPRSACATPGSTTTRQDNLLAYLGEQREATGTLPTDRQLTVERGRDEVGDWRVILHSPYGMQVHAPWALAVNARIRERLGVDGSAVASDDGIIARIPDATAEPPGAELFVFDPDELEQIVTDEVGGSALFASRFRECAARALLMPRRNPGTAQPAVAAAAALGAAARGGPPLPDVPDHPRDAARGAAGRLRRARAPAHHARHRRAPHPARRDRARAAVALRARPALRLRRRLHVRGRLAARRAPGRRALGRSRAAVGAARQGRDARAARPRHHRAVRARGAAPRSRAPRARRRGRRRPAAHARSARRRRGRGAAAARDGDGAGRAHDRGPRHPLCSTR